MSRTNVAENFARGVYAVAALSLLIATPLAAIKIQADGLAPLNVAGPVIRADKLGIDGDTADQFACKNDGLPTAFGNWSTARCVYDGKKSRALALAFVNEMGIVRYPDMAVQRAADSGSEAR